MDVGFLTLEFFFSRVLPVLIFTFLKEDSKRLGQNVSCSGPSFVVFFRFNFVCLSLRDTRGVAIASCGTSEATGQCSNLDRHYVTFNLGTCLCGAPAVVVLVCLPLCSE